MDQPSGKKSGTQKHKTSSNKLNSFFHSLLKEEPQPLPNRRSGKAVTDLSKFQVNQGQSALKPMIKASNLARTSANDTDAEFSDQQPNDLADDIKIVNEYVYEYYYAVRILPGQNLRSVFIGWVTSRFKPIHRPDEVIVNVLPKLIRHCTITQTRDDGSIVESIRRQDAYVICASDLLENMPDKANVARRVANGLLIGCLCDVSTGQLTFYVNGRESTQKYFVCFEVF